MEGNGIRRKPCVVFAILDEVEHVRSEVHVTCAFTGVRAHRVSQIRLQGLRRGKRRYRVPQGKEGAMRDGRKGEATMKEFEFAIEHRGVHSRYPKKCATGQLRAC